MKHNLPKPYLSYSAIDSWMKSPNQFRKRYYENAPSFVTPELNFGKKIADLLENKDESLAHIKQYATPEQQVQVDIEGVPIFGYIDSFDPETNSFYEFKTGRMPWTQKKVDKHLQLDIYSLCIEEIFGSVNDECMLIWMQTEKIVEPKVGLITHEDSHGIRLTGEVMEFTRVITDEERENTRTLIARVAQEISDDYTQYLDAKSKPKGLVDF
jgi:hypothetical protein